MFSSTSVCLFLLSLSQSVFFLCFPRRSDEEFAFGGKARDPHKYAHARVSVRKREQMTTTSNGTFPFGEENDSEDIFASISIVRDGQVSSPSWTVVVPAPRASFSSVRVGEQK